MHEISVNFTSLAMFTRLIITLFSQLKLNVHLVRFHKIHQKPRHCKHNCFLCWRMKNKNNTADAICGALMNRNEETKTNNRKMTSILKYQKHFWEVSWIHAYIFGVYITHAIKIEYRLGYFVEICCYSTLIFDSANQ